MRPFYVCHAPSTEWVSAVRVYRKGDWNFRSLGRPLLRLAFEGLEPCDGNLSRTVLRGPGISNDPWLPGPTHIWFSGNTLNLAQIAEKCEYESGIIRQMQPTQKAARLICSIMTISEGVNMQCLVDHVVLNVEHDEKMIAFYSKVLMFAPERLEEYRAGDVPFPSVRLNADTIIDLFPRKMWQTSVQAGQGRENLNHFCIALSKGTWEKLLKRLQSNNVDIEEGPVPRWGAYGTGTSIYFRDPEGNLLEARYYEDHNS